MTITPTRPGARQLTRDEAKVLAHYAAGESAKTITINTGFTMDLVGRVLDEHAGNDRARAHQLVLEYQEHAKAVAAARGTSPAVAALPRPAVPAKPAPPAPAVAARPVPVPPVVTKNPAAVKKATAAKKSAPPTPEATEPDATEPDATEPASSEPEGSEPEGSGPENTEPENTPDSSGPQGSAPEPAGELEALLQAAHATGLPRLQRAADKIRDLVAELRTDLADHLREAKLRAEQADLEARLAAIKEQLRPRRTPAVLATTATPALAETTAPATGTAARLDTMAVRAWAAEQGLACSAHGRIPGAIADAYRQAVTGR